jgi:2-keto-4-pentenoate hydratase/2-oxohepta-3-ene-1,7-dioic acid hydratase in catechol pathway
MRLASYERGGRWRAAVALDGGLVDAAAAAARGGLGEHDAWETVRGMLAMPADRLAQLEDTAHTMLAEGPSEAVLRRDDVRLGPPVPDPEKILCVGLNYRAHAAEAALDEPTVPMIFAKFPNTLIPSGAPILMPERYGDQIDFEGEIAVVIGRRAYDLPEDRALDAIAGWMPFNDVTARDLQRRTSQWTAGKSPDTFGPCGPHLVLDDALRTGGLELETHVNGERVQQAHSDQMIFSVAQLISFLTSFMTLMPGDIIATGTPHGVGAHRTPPEFLQPGDVIEVRVNEERLENQLQRAR